jgi:hypothetical protein
MFHPQRAVLVESGNPFFGWNKLRASGFRGRADEVHDGLLGGAVVPRGQRILCSGSAVSGEGHRQQQGKGEADRFHNVSTVVMSGATGFVSMVCLTKPDDDKPPRRRCCHPVR